MCENCNSSRQLFEGFEPISEPFLLEVICSHSSFGSNGESHRNRFLVVQSNQFYSWPFVGTSDLINDSRKPSLIRISLIHTNSNPRNLNAMRLSRLRKSALWSVVLDRIILLLSPEPVCLLQDYVVVFFKLCIYYRRFLKCLNIWLYHCQVILLKLWMKSNIDSSFFFFFFKFFVWTKVHFVEPLIAPVLDFVCSSSWVSNPEWTSCLYSFLLACCDPEGHVWCDTCLFHQQGCTLYKACIRHGGQSCSLHAIFCNRGRLPDLIRRPPAQWADVLSTWLPRPADYW